VYVYTKGKLMKEVCAVQLCCNAECKVSAGDIVSHFALTSEWGWEGTEVKEYTRALQLGLVPAEAM
jgi:hypothetical protein